MSTQDHRYIPNTSKDRERILKACGKSEFDDFLRGIPEDIRFKRELFGGREPLSEFEIQAQIQKMFSSSRTQKGAVSFLGSGSYDRFCPSHVNQLTLRGEFLTAYTPYQPENSQGTLQALFEFQSMVAEIFGMDVATASHYDGATALAEALLLAKRVKKGAGIVCLSEGINSEYLEVCRSYLSPQNFEVRWMPVGSDGRTDLSALRDAEPGQMICAAVQSPNVYGVVEDLEGLVAETEKQSALSVVAVSDPLAMGLYEAPGSHGVDVVTAEGQGLGLPQSFGGPYLGLFCAKKQYVRQLPGRLCGESVDAEGRRSFTLTLSTREQHIRREKATSNICTNQSLCALWATIWLASFGKLGFREIAEHNYSKTQFLKKQLEGSPACELRFPDAEIFNEFTLDLKKGTAEDFFEFAAARGLAPGLPLSRGLSDDKTGLVVCCTEKRTKAELENYVKVINEWGA